MGYDKKYVYDKGFGKIVLFCPNCGSYHLLPKYKGGYGLHDWFCKDCHHQCDHNIPMIDHIDEVKEYIDMVFPTPERASFDAKDDLVIDFFQFGGKWEDHLN